MGFNTTVFILNDQLDSIRRDPERFVAEISRGLRGDTHVVGQTTVMPTRHADEFRLYCSQYNSMVELSPWAQETIDLVMGNPHAMTIVRERIDQARRYLDLLEGRLDDVAVGAENNDLDWP